tara:strand:- start:1008 stop:2879 length:1872 start_codon:yes stop_codon:yes gene_type:complete
MADYNININAKDNASGAISKVSGGLGGLTASAGRFKAAIGVAGAAFAALGAVKIVGDKITAMDDLAKSARSAGAAMSGEAFEGFQVMRQAMNEAGVDAATFDRAMLQTTSRLQAGTEGQKSFAKITDKLGDSIKGMNGELKSGPELLQSMMNALNEGTITTEEFAKVVGGRAGPLIQSQFGKINDSAEKMQATLDDVAQNSNIVSLESAQQAEAFNDNIGRLKEGMGQLLTDAIQPLMPVLLKLSEDILAKMPAILESVQGALSTLQPVFQLLGTLLVEVVWPIMQKIFEVLGHIATAITPLIETALPLLKEGFQFIVDVATSMWNIMKTVYEVALPALEAGFNGLKAIVDAVVATFNSAVAGLQAVKDKAIELKDATVGAFTSMKDGVVGSTKGMVDGATGWATSMYDEWVGNSIFPDLRDAVISSFSTMATQSVNETQRMANQTTNAATQGAKTFEDVFANTLGNALQTGKLDLGNFASFFMQKMGSMGQGAGGLGGIIGQLFGGGGMGGGGGLGGLISGIFGGGGGGIGGMLGFAGGGYTGSGARAGGMDGKGGFPAMLHPNETVVDHENGGNTGGGAQVNITIQAIDTQSGTQFLLDNKKQIEGIIQNAFNRRGKQGIY